MAIVPNNQGIIGIPQLTSHLVNPDFTIGGPWYRFLISLWQRTGGAFVLFVNTIFLFYS